VAKQEREDEPLSVAEAEAAEEAGVLRDAAARALHVAAHRTRVAGSERAAISAMMMSSGSCAAACA
jgi:hypothetical protein